MTMQAASAAGHEQQGTRFGKHSAQADLQVDADDTDEVRVFSAAEEEDQCDSQLLVEDKKDVTFQAEQPSSYPPFPPTDGRPSLAAEANATQRIRQATEPETSGAQQNSSSKSGGSGDNSAENVHRGPVTNSAFSKFAQQSSSNSAHQAQLLNGLAVGCGSQYAAAAAAAAATSPIFLFPSVLTGQSYGVPMSSPLFAWPPRPPTVPLLEQQDAMAAAAAAKTGGPFLPIPTAGGEHSNSITAFEVASAAVWANLAAAQRFNSLVPSSVGTLGPPIHGPFLAAQEQQAKRRSPTSAITSQPQLDATSHLQLINNLNERFPFHPFIQLQRQAATAAAVSLPPSADATAGRTPSLKQRTKNCLASPSARKRRTNGELKQQQSVVQQCSSAQDEKAKVHVKKPLNAFMIFMKENRQKLAEERGFKEKQSAELNKELGRLWHTLSSEEQQQYYAKSEVEKRRHKEMYPGWSARENYAVHKKNKRRRKRDTPSEEDQEQKKCRARFGLQQQLKWCKHCRRKKKCLWFKPAPGQDDDDDEDDEEDGEGEEDGDECADGGEEVSSTTNSSSPAEMSAAAVVEKPIKSELDDCRPPTNSSSQTLRTATDGAGSTASCGDGQVNLPLAVADG